MLRIDLKKKKCLLCFKQFYSAIYNAKDANILFYGTNGEYKYVVSGQLGELDRLIDIKIEGNVLLQIENDDTKGEAYKRLIADYLIGGLQYYVGIDKCPRCGFIFHIDSNKHSKSIAIEKAEIDIQKVKNELHTMLNNN